MIESIAAAAAQKAVETVSSTIKEGVSKLTRELGRPASEGEGYKPTTGGNATSVLRALDINPASLGDEVRAASMRPERAEQIPLLDSKGEARHHLSAPEAAHYERIGLRAQDVNGHECLVRNDINLGQRDAYGLTNQQRMGRGLAPLDPEGRPYELHHIQQRADGVLAELTRAEHRGSGIDRLLHDPKKESEINRAAFDQTRAAHWQARASEVQS